MLADNYKGGTDRVTNVLGFAGRILKSKTKHAENNIVWKDVVGSTVEAMLGLLTLTQQLYDDRFRVVSKE